MLLDTLQCTGQPHNGGRTEDTKGAAVEKRRSVAGRRLMLLVLMLSLLVLGLLPVDGSAWSCVLAQGLAVVVASEQSWGPGWAGPSGYSHLLCRTQPAPVP